LINNIIVIALLIQVPGFNESVLIRYLAADTQLFAFGLAVCIMFRTRKSRTIALLGIFLMSLIIVILHTYFEDLDAVVLQKPE
jgi:hypothetical protein